MPDNRLLGDPGVTQVTELIRLADRFGLTWGRRPGTVTSVSSPFTAREASVRMDGDDTGVTVVSLAGNLAVGDRIMVDRVPPAGLYAIAILNRDLPVPSPADAPMSVSAVTDSASTATEAVVLTVIDATLVAGSVYVVDVGGSVVGAPGESFTYGLRKGTTVAGTLWAVSPPQSIGGSTFQENAPWVTYITTPGTMTTSISLTLTPGSGSITHAGSALSPRYLTIRRVSVSTGAYPQAIEVA